MRFLRPDGVTSQRLQSAEARSSREAQARQSSRLQHLVFWVRSPQPSRAQRRRARLALLANPERRGIPRL